MYQTADIPRKKGKVRFFGWFSVRPDIRLGDGSL